MTALAPSRFTAPHTRLVRVVVLVSRAAAPHDDRREAESEGKRSGQFLMYKNWLPPKRLDTADAADSDYSYEDIDYGMTS